MRTGKHRFEGFATGKHRFQIPEYQRNFSWEKPHLTDLWRDLNEHPEKTHFFGTILIQEAKGRGPRDTVYDIIDGQQRLTSLTILLHEFARALEASGHDTLAKQIIDEYIVRQGDYKLTLLGDDAPFFKDHILDGRLDKEGTGHNERRVRVGDISTPSRDRLSQAKALFREWIQEKGQALGEDEFEEYATTILTKIENLELMVYEVESRADAVRIFQTVNDRGKGLSKLEITKSFLMHQLYLSIPDDREGDNDEGGNGLLREQLQGVQREFGEIYEYIEEITDTKQGEGLTEDLIQRYHFILWNTEWTTGRDKRYWTDYLPRLKQNFRKQNDPKGEGVRGYTHELKRSFQAATKILSLDVEQENLRKRLQKLFSLDRVRNFLPLLIAGWLKYEEGDIALDEYRRLVEKVETFVVRVHVIRQMQSNTGRGRAYRLARDLYQTDSTGQAGPVDIQGAIDKLEAHINDYCDDARLRRTLSDAEVYTNYSDSNRLKELRFLLYSWEQSLESELEGIDLTYLDVIENREDKFTVEHIWPQDPGRLNLDEEGLDDHEENKHRLGNLAFLIGEWQPKQSNKAFADKRSLYGESKLRMLREIAKEGRWGPTQIEARENAMIDVIINRWPDEFETSGADQQVLVSENGED